MSYKKSFLLMIVGFMIVATTELLGIFFIFHHVKSIKGWTSWEIVYLYAIASISFGIAEFLSAGIHQVPLLIQSGEFSQFLTRPLSPLFQILSHKVLLFKLGRSLQGIFALIIALINLKIVWNLLNITLLFISIFSSIIIYISLFLLSATLCFWTIQSTELFNAFTYGGHTMTQFPISIYRNWMKKVFLFIIPIAFSSYFPSIIILNKSEPLGYPRFFAYISPFVALTFTGFSIFLWNIGINHYQSTGT